VSLPVFFRFLPARTGPVGGSNFFLPFVGSSFGGPPGAPPGPDCACPMALHLAAPATPSSVALNTLPPLSVRSQFSLAIFQEHFPTPVPDAAQPAVDCTDSARVCFTKQT